MTPLSGQDTDRDLSVTGVGHTCGVGLPEFVTAFPQCMCLVPRIVIVGLHFKDVFDARLHVVGVQNAGKLCVVFNAMLV